MSDYSYTDNTGEFIGLWGQAEYKRVVIGRNGGDHNVDLANTDAPKFALEILKAAGHGESHAADELAAMVRIAENLSKVAELNRRRDEVALEFTADTRGTLSGACNYAGLLPWTRKMVDRIIELEARS